MGGGLLLTLCSRRPGRGQREPASRVRAETPGDVHPAGPGAQSSFLRVNGCLPCSSEGISPSPVCPASLLTLLFPSRCSGECGGGSFKSLSLGQGVAKEDPFPPPFPALQLLRALHCSLALAHAEFSGLPPCPLLGAGPPFLVGSPWSWCRTRLKGDLGVFPAPQRGHPPLFWGVRGRFSTPALLPGAGRAVGGRWAVGRACLVPHHPLHL